jgi:hypothetical protein
MSFLGELLSPANDQAHLPGPLVRRYVAEKP